MMTELRRAATASRDGTTISYDIVGEGPGIVLVPGALHSGHHYEKLARALAGEFTVYAVDRRGRPGSGPQKPDHGIDAECDDIAAVLAETKASMLFGHSSGAVVALQAALRHPVEKIAVYEPPVMFADSPPPVRELAEMERLAAKGREPEAFAILAKAEAGPVGKLPLFALKFLFRLASGGAEEKVGEYIAAVGTYPAEQRMVMSLRETAGAYRGIRAETLVMLGDRSPRELAAAARFLGETIPGARLEVLSGLDHDAPDEKAPERVAAGLRAFFHAGG